MSQRYGNCQIAKLQLIDVALRRRLGVRIFCGSPNKTQALSVSSLGAFLVCRIRVANWVANVAFSFNVFQYAII